MYDLSTTTKLIPSEYIISRFSQCSASEMSWPSVSAYLCFFVGIQPYSLQRVGKLVNDNVVPMVVRVSSRAHDVFLRNQSPITSNSGQSLVLAAVKSTRLATAAIAATCSGDEGNMGEKKRKKPETVCIIKYLKKWLYL